MICVLRWCDFRQLHSQPGHMRDSWWKCIMHAVERFALKKLQANHCKPFVCHAAAATWALNISVRSRSILSLCETLESDSYGPAKEAKDLLSNLSLFLVYVEGQPEALDDHVMRMAKRHVKLFFFEKKHLWSQEGRYGRSLPSTESIEVLRAVEPSQSSRETSKAVVGNLLHWKSIAVTLWDSRSFVSWRKWKKLLRSLSVNLMTVAIKPSRASCPLCSRWVGSLDVGETKWDVAIGHCNFFLYG